MPNSSGSSAPGVGRRQEAVARHVMDAMADGEVAYEDGVELGVQQCPAAFIRLPVFADPMVFIFPGVEISAETAPAACWDAVVAEDGDGEQHEMPTDADQPPLGRTGDRQGLAIKRQQPVDNGLDRADMALGAALGGDRAAVERLGDVFVDQQALDDARYVGGVGRQGVEQCGVAAGRAEGGLPRIIVEDGFGAFVGKAGVSGVRACGIEGVHGGLPSSKRLSLCSAAGLAAALDRVCSSRHATTSRRVMAANRHRAFAVPAKTCRHGHTANGTERLEDR